MSIPFRFFAKFSINLCFVLEGIDGHVCLPIGIVELMRRSGVHAFCHVARNFHGCISAVLVKSSFFGDLRVLFVHYEYLTRFSQCQYPAELPFSPLEKVTIFKDAGRNFCNSSSLLF